MWGGIVSRVCGGYVRVVLSMSWGSPVGWRGGQQLRSSRSRWWSTGLGGLCAWWGISQVGKRVSTCPGEYIGRGSCACRSGEMLNLFGADRRDTLSHQSLGRLRGAVICYG